MLNIEGRMRRRGDMNTQVLHVAEVLVHDETLEKERSIK
jgi:hypothetical protein